MKMKISNVFASLLVAAIALLATVNGRIYRTNNDAIVFEIDRASDGSFLAKSFPLSQSDFIPIKNFLTGGLVPNQHIPLVAETKAGFRTGDFLGRSNSYNNMGQMAPQQGMMFPPWFYYPFALYGGASPVVPAIGSASGQPLGEESKQAISCGAGPDETRIVNGTEANPNSWPFVVAFMKPNSGVVNCGGSLISETKILTAAHCFERMSTFEMSQMVVKLGMHHRGDGAKVADDAQVTRRISGVKLHAQFNNANLHFDVAIVTMDSPVTYSENISPVCLVPSNNRPNVYAKQTASIIGWGKLKSGGTAPLKLMQAKVPIITNEECKKIFPFSDQITTHMMCARSTSSDVCQGDSGGPLVIRSAVDGLWSQVGIVSWGSSECKNPKAPASVYTRVNILRSWINTNMA